LKPKSLYIILFSFIPFAIFSQTLKTLKTEANNLFEINKFVAATPLFSRLLAIEPTNHEYNFKYGTCLLFQSNDKQKALYYLQYAVKSAEIQPEAYFYLGRAFHLNYLFKEAIKSYTKFITLVPNSDLKNAAERYTYMCQNGKNKLTQFTDFEVIDKQEIESEDFYRSYKLTQLGGELIVVAEFQTKLDKKKNHLPLVYFGSGSTEIYYASYGEDATNGLDIYKRSKAKSGGWSEPIKLSSTINTSFDENYPFFNEKTRELFFSSNSYESIGGFDIFKAKQFNEDQFSKPKAIDFAISSSDDDLLYISDSLDQLAFFASTRNCEAGKINLYTIKNERFIQNDRLVKGDFVSSLENGITISVIQQKTGKTIGNFSSNENKGYYFLFPEPGAYSFACKLATQSTVIPLTVEIPTSSNRLPLAQQIVHKRIGGEDRLSLFSSDTITAQNSPEILAELIRQKATLDRSTSPMSGEKVSTENQPELAAKVLKQEAELHKKIALKAETLSAVNAQVATTENAFDYAIYLKNKRLVELNQNLKALIVAYNNEKVQDKKQTILQDANQLVNVLKKVEEQKEALLILKQQSLSPVKQQLSAVDQLQLAPILDKLSTAIAVEKPANLSPTERAALENFQARKLQTPVEIFVALQDSLVVKQQKLKESLLSNAKEISALQNTIAQLAQQFEQASDKKKITIEEQKNSALSTLKTYQEEQAIVTKKTTLLQDKINEIQTKNSNLSTILATEIPASSSVKELLAASQQQVASNNSATLQDFIALTVQKNPLPPVSTSLIQKFENEQKSHQQAIEKIQQSKANEAVKQELLTTQNKKFIARLDEIDSQLDLQTPPTLSTKEQEILGQLAQRIEQAKEATVVTIADHSKDSDASKLANSPLANQQSKVPIEEQLKILHIKSSNKLSAIEANTALEAAEKMQLVEQENRSMQLQEDSISIQIEQLKSTDPTKDFSKERIELARLIKERAKNVQSAIQRIEQAANSTIQPQENLADTNSNALTSNVSKTDTSSRSSDENTTSSSDAINEFQRSLNLLQANFEQQTARIQTTKYEEKISLLQEQAIAWRSQLEAKKETLTSSSLTLAEKAIVNQLIDSTIALIDQQLAQRSDEHKVQLSNLSEDQLQQNQATYLRKIGVLSPVMAILSGKSTLPKEAQLNELQQARTLLQAAHKQEVVLQQKNPTDIQGISNQFYNEQLLYSIEETQQNLENEIKLSVIEAEEHEQIAQLSQRAEQENQENEAVETGQELQNVDKNTDLSTSLSSLEAERNFVFKLRSSFKSKEILNFNAQQDAALLQLKLAEWKRYNSFLTSQLKELEDKKTSKLDVELEKKWIAAEIDQVQQNTTELTRLIATKTKTNSITSKQTLPENSVLQFPPSDTAGRSLTFIPMDVTLPNGLLYRVQIGAFTKPMLAGNHPSIEPISGERMRNGWYRYLSGYFGSFDQAITAQTYIRQNGFADAYLVAYCDGQKISLQQASEYLYNGLCKPYNGTTEVLANANRKKPIEDNVTTETVIIPNPTSIAVSDLPAYFKGVNAVAATPIETISGLFYSVQIGAFSTPATAQITKDLSPLYTFLLPNKHIRYSVGKFDRLSDALEQKKKVIEKGFKDAFIVIYYNGERITLQAAQQLIQSKGNAVFANPVAVQVENISEASPAISSEIVPDVLPVEPATIEKIVHYQFVSKKSFSAFPIDVLNRYNSKGTFYYDPSDGKVKSAIVPTKEALPRVFSFKNDVDTLEIISNKNEVTTEINVNFVNQTIAGDVADWLQRLPYSMHFTNDESGCLLKIVGVKQEELEAIEKQLNRFELNFTLQKNDID
jgi:hypothetical protein